MSFGEGTVYLWWTILCMVHWYSHRTGVNDRHNVCLHVVPLPE